MKKKNKTEKSTQNIKTTIKTTKYMLNIVWKEKQGKVFLLIQNVMAILNAVFPVVYTIFPGLIINELLNKQDIVRLIIYVGVLIITPVISQILNAIAEIYSSKLSMALDLKFTADFYDHITSMDYELLENPEIQIMQERAQDTIGSIINVTKKTTALLSAVIGLLAVSTIISTLNPLIILLIVIILLANSTITKKLNYKSHLIGKELSNYDRYQWGFTYMLGHFSYAKEIRIFNLKSFLINIFVNSKKESNKLEIKQQKTSRYRDVFTAATSFLQQIVLYIYLIYNVIAKGLAVGDMTIYMAAVGQFAGVLNGVFNSYIGLENDSLKTQELMDFMNTPLRKHQTGDITPVFDRESTIEFKNVSFKYPGSDRYALHNMNITFRGDEKLCIVGVNGSGKSTFIKLLTRLYVLLRVKYYLMA